MTGAKPDLHQVTKIAVIGCPGAGKSTFSLKLAEKLKLPLIHLDMYYHDTSKPYAHAEDRSAWLEKVKDLVEKPKWIMDGNYKSTFEYRFSAADIIIFLDFPKRILLYRVYKRRWEFRKSSPRRRLDMPEDWNEKVDWEFFKVIWDYKRDQSPLIAKMAHKTSSTHKFLRFTSPQQLEAFLETLDASKATLL